MEIELAEVIVEACVRNGIKAELQKDYSASWMRGRKTTGVVIAGGDLAQVVAAIIASAHLFVDGELPKFAIENYFHLFSFLINYRFEKAKSG